MSLPADPLAALRQARRDPDLVLIEGFHALKHALRFGAEILHAAITDRDEMQALAAALAPDIPARLPANTLVVSPERLQAAGLKAPITGVIGLARRPSVDVAAALVSRRPAPIVLLERPRGLGNIGWCVRTAAAADAAGLFTTGIHDPWCPTAVRIGVGLQFALPVTRIADTDLNSDRMLIAVDTSGETVHPQDLPPRAILAFGTERHGLSAELLDRAQMRVSLPMREGVSSLNLATSVSALLYAWRLSVGG
ncbi:MAG TPA: TrmH family RNA methyltransferase [Solirubrobacteraceae bacterium]|jgi:TrmH family RNA methyltransferase|nr:TrmH family RNA methyltransferase [Solirubrobacteraceae bacterium]